MQLQSVRIWARLENIHQSSPQTPVPLQLTNSNSDFQPFAHGGHYYLETRSTFSSKKTIYFL